LAWDTEAGWLDHCVPKECGLTPRPPRASPVSDEEAPNLLFYPEAARFVCEPGFVSEYWDLVPQDSEAGARQPPAYIRSSGEYCTSSPQENLCVHRDAGEAECRALCDASSECTAIELPCAGGCVLLARCEERLPSSCGAQLLDRQPLPAERVVALRCMPVCGDGVLVPTDHLPLDSRLQQCDDGNAVDGDGCSAACRVEPDFVCAGGSPMSADRCQRADASILSAMWVTVTGARVPDEAEFQWTAEVALSRALGCPLRDLEVTQVRSSLAGQLAAATSGAPRLVQASTTTRTTTTTLRSDSRFFVATIELEIRFKVKVSSVTKLSSEELEGALRRPGSFLPKAMVAYTDHTSLNDMYIRASALEAPRIVGDAQSLLRVPSLRRDLVWLAYRVGPVVVYLTLIGGIAPAVRYVVKIRQRQYRMMGNLETVAAVYKGGWAFTICEWIRYKTMCCCLVVCLPSRLADTWDSVGIMPYWVGVRHAFCCCLLYMTGCCVCAAVIPGQQRSEMRDFFGFGDKVKGNLELSDYCCYLCCPVCCVIQEALHVDRAHARLTFDLEDAFAKDEPPHDTTLDDIEDELSELSAPEPAIMGKS